MIERNTTAGVLEKDGLFLVGERKEGGPLSLKWEFIGGKNRYGESLGETLEREWMEELGLRIKTGPFLLNTEFTNGETHYTLHCFRVFLVEEPGEISSTIHKSLRWVDKTELSLLDFGPSDSVIRDYICSTK